MQKTLVQPRLPRSRNERRRFIRDAEQQIGFECESCHAIYEQGLMVEGKVRCPRCYGFCHRCRLDVIRRKIEEKRLKE